MTTETAISKAKKQKPRDNPLTITVNLSREKRLKFDSIGLDVDASMNKLVRQVKAVLKPCYPEEILRISWSHMEAREKFDVWPCTDADRARKTRQLIAVVDKVWEISRWLVFAATPENIPVKLSVHAAKPQHMPVMEYLDLLTCAVSEVKPYDAIVNRFQKWCYKQGVEVHPAVCFEMLQQFVASRAVPPLPRVVFNKESVPPQPAVPVMELTTAALDADTTIEVIATAISVEEAEAEVVPAVTTAKPVAEVIQAAKPRRTDIRAARSTAHKDDDGLCSGW